MDPRSYRRQFALRNGTQFTLRAISADDEARLLAAFQALDPQSIYTRFMSVKHNISDDELKSATHVDFDLTVALVAVVATAAKEVIIGGGRYVRLSPREPDVAEIAFTIEEDFQRQGLAGLILHELAEIAKGAGITRFVAEVLPGNTAMLKVFRRSGISMSVHHEAGIAHVELQLLDRGERTKPTQPY